MRKHRHTAVSAFIMLVIGAMTAAFSFISAPARAGASGSAIRSQRPPNSPVSLSAYHWRLDAAVYSTEYYKWLGAAVYSTEYYMWLDAAVYATGVQEGELAAVSRHTGGESITGPTNTSNGGGGGGGAGGRWAAIRQCESGGNYSDNTGNGYYGAYQFSTSTWHSLGYSGVASDYSASVQDQAAQQLEARSGWGQWPVCGTH